MERADQVSIGLVKLWLEEHGWRLAPVGLDNLSMWVLEHKDTHESAQVMVPERPDFADYSRRIRDLLLDLGAVYSWTPDAVLQELISARADVLEFKSAEETDLDGSIPVHGGIQLFTGIRRLLESAARATREKRPFYGKKYYKEARRFMETARLGQTATGSYIVRVISATPGDRIQLTDTDSRQVWPTDTESKSRMVVHTLVRAAGAAREALDHYREVETPMGFYDAVNAGVSSELCKALAEMNESAGRSAIELSVDWSLLEIPPVDVPRTIRFTHRDVPALRMATELLKETSVERGVTVEGWVETMSKSEGRGGGPGVVTIHVERGALQKGLKLRAGLGPKDHAVAHRAYGTGERVRIQGDLSRHGQGAFSINNGRLEILEGYPTLEGTESDGASTGAEDGDRREPPAEPRRPEAGA